MATTPGPDDIGFLRDLVANFGAGGVTMGIALAYLYARYGRTTVDGGVKKDELRGLLGGLRDQLRDMERTMNDVDQIVKAHEKAIHEATLERKQEIDLLKQINEHLWEVRLRLGWAEKER